MSSGGGHTMWKVLSQNAKAFKKVVSKLSSGEGRTSNNVSEAFKNAGWIGTSTWVKKSQLELAKFIASPSKNIWGHHLSRSIRQFRSSAKPKAGNSRPFNPEELVGGQLPTRFSNMDRIKYILNPVIFTAAVGTGSIICCTIWQYEEYRSSQLSTRFSLSSLRRSVFGEASPSQGSSRPHAEAIDNIKSWWDSLSPAEKIFWPICGLNVLVWGAWRIPGMAPAMVSYFSATPVSRHICLPMLLSTFSHYSLLHLCANMFVLHSFIPAAVQILGKEQFVAMYLTAGTVSSLGSHLHKLYIRNITPSLGASGAIMGILGLVCTRMPDIQLGIIFIPGLQFTADTALKCILAVDAAGIICGWKIMDHAAHLSGCLFGIAFSHWGGQTFWAFRDFVMTEWHKFRSQGRLS